MKMDMMVVGIKAVTDDVMELEIVPLVKEEKNISISDFIGGKARDIQKAIENTRQHRGKLYMSREWCSSNTIMPFTGLIISIEVPDPKKISDKYVK